MAKQSTFLLGGRCIARNPILSVFVVCWPRVAADCRTTELQSLQAWLVCVKDLSLRGISCCRLCCSALTAVLQHIWHLCHPHRTTPLSTQSLPKPRLVSDLGLLPQTPVTCLLPLHHPSLYAAREIHKRQVSRPVSRFS